MKKKEYKTPSVRTEKVTIGVFGDYGDCGGGDGGRGNDNPIPHLQPFFNLCCG